MGAWSLKSDANDDTMDILVDYFSKEEVANEEDNYDKTRFNSLQDMADACLEEQFDIGKFYSSLGLVMYFLMRAIHIDDEYLYLALEYAEYELNSDNVNDWFDFDARKEQLEYEIVIIESAINNGGYIDIDYIIDEGYEGYDV